MGKKISKIFYSVLAYLIDLPIVDRLVKCIIPVIVVIAAVLWICYQFLVTIVWIIVNTLELCLLIPFFFIWLLTGKFYGYKIENWINDRTGFFNSMYVKNLK